MVEIFDLILKGGIVVNQDGEGVCDVVVWDGWIVEFGLFDVSQVGEVVDCVGLYILFGVMDIQVYFCEFGIEYKEDFESGLCVVVMGGVISVFEMLNINLLIIDEVVFVDKVCCVYYCMYCDFVFWVGGICENVVDILELECFLVVVGIKVFMGFLIGDFLVEDDEGV